MTTNDPGQQIDDNAPNAPAQGEPGEADLSGGLPATTSNEPSQEAVNAWVEAFGEDADPAQIKSEHEWLEAVTSENPVVHEANLTTALHDWEYLKPGETVSDLKAALEAYRTAESTTQQVPQQLQQQQTEAPQFSPEQIQFLQSQGLIPGQESSPMETQQAEETGYDPEVVQQDIDARFEAMQIAQNVEAQLGKVEGTDEYQSYIRSQVGLRLESGEVDMDKLGSLVTDVENELRQVMGMELKDVVDKNSTKGTGPGSNTPGTTPVPKGLEDIGKLTAQKLGLEHYE